MYKFPVKMRCPWCNRKIKRSDFQKVDKRWLNAVSCPKFDCWVVF